MWTIIVAFLGRLFSNPIVRSVATNALSNLVTHGKDLVPLALAEIKAVSVRDDLSGTGKLNLVVTHLAEQFPGIAKDIIVQVAQETFVAWVNPDVKNVT